MQQAIYQQNNPLKTVILNLIAMKSSRIFGESKDKLLVYQNESCEKIFLQLLKSIINPIDNCFREWNELFL